ncbi:hypothetical protein DRW03_21695 [Corallococcus sp. H22C18031201]|uniref:hypothetical protein n=1 Tax=Citreicoccus inhibens TaxID=2849499 RepID=UPI000E729EBA|nr:hypothetical protein [Citreicoccus inhibens]MBU8897013.1 hypothetical protein [Citreicoccus inhibens]RJS19639.1 hypothetical protein DRW03_21695 [Corallococcus sp. H22C18031201]
MRRASVVLGCVLSMAWGACTRPQALSGLDAGTVAAEGLPGCLHYGEPRRTGTVPPELPELSGLAASHRHPGVFWAHNDSGNAFEVFAINEAGQVLARVTLTGAESRDIEDVAVGPCAPGDTRPCIWLADTGDNFGLRREVRLYRLPEPEVLGNATLAVETLPFRYPDGTHDTESLIIEQQTGRLAVITKTRKSLGEVFALDGLRPDSVTVATKLGTLHAPGEDHRSTAADLHPGGQRMLVRTYSRVWEVRRPGATSLEELVHGDVVEVPGASQAQAEAVAFLPDGRGYLLGSEFTGQPLVRVDCR